MLALKKVSDIMAAQILSISADEPVKDAANKILKVGVGSLAVKKDGVIVGIITHKDFVKSIAADKKDRVVEDIMSSSIISTDSDADLMDVFKLMMENRISHIFVKGKKKIGNVDFKGIIGIVSLKDVLTHLPEYVK